MIKKTFFCCDDCMHFYGLTPKIPADSGGDSKLCAVCGHYGIGSRIECVEGDWGWLHPCKELK